MKKEDLRIGNHITDEFWDNFKTVIVVESVNDKGVNLSITDDGNWPECAQHFIEPEYEFKNLRGIPLSNEWNNNTIYIKSEYQQAWIRFMYDEENKMYGILCDIDEQQIGEKMYYYHQIQNIYYSLIGIEFIDLAREQKY